MNQSSEEVELAGLPRIRVVLDRYDTPRELQNAVECSMLLTEESLRDPKKVEEVMLRMAGALNRAVQKGKFF